MQEGRSPPQPLRWRSLGQAQAPAGALSAPLGAAASEGGGAWAAAAAALGLGSSSPAGQLAQQIVASSGGEAADAEAKAEIEGGRAEGPRQCMECGARKASPSGQGWTRHPETHAEWMCKGCYSAAYRELKRQQRQQQVAELTCSEKGDGGEEGEAEGLEEGVEEEGVEKEEEKGEANGKVCSHCGTDSTARDWRRHPITHKRLCNACRSYMDNHSGQMRPVGVQCLHCRSGSPGHNSAAWRPHPVTGARWLCSPCFYTARREADQRQCMECSAASPGVGKANWHRHPVTGAEWLCLRCYSRQRTTRRLRQKRAEGAAGDSGQRRRQSGVREQQQAATPGSNGAEILIGRPAKLAAIGNGAGARHGGALLPGQPHTPVQPAPPQPPQPLPQPEQSVLQTPQQLQPDLFTLLLQAAGSAAAAASGLTADLAASFSALMDTLPADQQAAKEGRLRALLAQGRLSAAAQLMSTALRLAGLV